MSGLWTWEVLGIAVEVYGYDVLTHSRLLYPSTSGDRAKVRQVRKEDDRERLLARLQTARDLCSVAACNTAFEDCKEGDAYDLGACLRLMS
jgi:hypothetical protein